MSSDRSIESKPVKSSSSSSADTKTQVSEIKKDEAMPVHFPPGLDWLVMDYLNGSIDANWPGDEKTKPFPIEKRNEFRLFNTSVASLMTGKKAHPDPEAGLIGNLILCGEENGVKDALDLLTKKIEKDPNYLDYHVTATDPLGRKAKGTLLQLAAIAGDVDLKAGIQDEKERGLVERIANITKLSQEDIALQLQVVTSKEAKQANQNRNKRILDAVKRFGEGIIAKRNEYKDYEDSAFEKHMKEAFPISYMPLIEQFEKDLTPDLKEETTLGYIFDPTVLIEAADWFEYGYDLCPMSDDVQLEKGKIYLREKEGCIAYSVITPDGEEVRDIKIEEKELKAPKNFELNELNKLKNEIMEATSKAGHAIKNIDRFGGWWDIRTSIFWLNGIGKLQSKLSIRDKQTLWAGVGNLLEKDKIPVRSLNTSLSNLAHLGLDFYIGYYGDESHPSLWSKTGESQFRSWVEKLCQIKITALQAYATCERSILFR